MTDLTNGLEGGSNGTTLTQGSGGNTGGASGAFLDDIFIGTSAANTFDNTHAAHGSLSMKCATGASAVQVYGGWNTSLGSGLSQVWFRAYYWIGANPSGNHGIVMFKSASGGSQVARFVLTTTGKIQCNDAANTAITGMTTTNSVNTSAWFRIEGFVISSATVGQVELKLFNSMDSTTATETLTSAATQNTGSGIGEEIFGQAGSGVASENLWVDDLGVSTTAYLGPATSVSPAGLLICSFPP